MILLDALVVVAHECIPKVFCSFCRHGGVSRGRPVPVRKVRTRRASGGRSGPLRFRGGRRLVLAEARAAAEQEIYDATVVSSRRDWTAAHQTNSRELPPRRHCERQYI